jgi:hypothetical protein
MFADTKAVSERFAELHRTRSLRGKTRILLETLFRPPECSDTNGSVSQNPKLLYPLRRLKDLLRSEYGKSMFQICNSDENDLILVNPGAAKTLKSWLLKV